MTRKHFEAIARDISNQRLACLGAFVSDDEERAALDALEHTAMRLALTFKQDNPRFDNAGFLSDCGFPV